MKLHNIKTTTRKYGTHPNPTLELMPGVNEITDEQYQALKHKIDADPWVKKVVERESKVKVVEEAVQEVEKTEEAAPEVEEVQVESKEPVQDEEKVESKSKGGRRKVQQPVAESTQESTEGEQV